MKLIATTLLAAGAAAIHLENTAACPSYPQYTSDNIYLMEKNYEEKKFKAIFEFIYDLMDHSGDGNISEHEFYCIIMYMVTVGEVDKEDAIEAHKMFKDHAENTTKEEAYKEYINDLTLYARMEGVRLDQVCSDCTPTL